MQPREGHTPIRLQRLVAVSRKEFIHVRRDWRSLLLAILLSGFIFPIHSMPEAIQWLIVFNPMRWFLQILHGIVVKRVGLPTLWAPLVAMTLLAISFLTLAVARFKKTLE